MEEGAVPETTGMLSRDPLPQVGADQELVPTNNEQMQVACPTGCSPGDRIAVTVSDGRQLHVRIPEGTGAGDVFLISVPALQTPSTVAAKLAPDKNDESREPTSGSVVPRVGTTLAPVPQFAATPNAQSHKLRQDHPGSDGHTLK